jgi:hypothetical protein
MMTAPEGAQPPEQSAPEKTVCIEVSADGTYMVGLEPQGQPEGQLGEEAQEKSWMSPVKNLDDALRVARDLLTNDQAQSAEDNQAFEGGFKQGMGV